MPSGYSPEFKPSDYHANKLRELELDPAQLIMQDLREMTAKEYIDSKLPGCHSARREINILIHCRNNPFKWAMWDLKRRWLPFIHWRSPIEK